MHLFFPLNTDSSVMIIQDKMEDKVKTSYLVGGCFWGMQKFGSLKPRYRVPLCLRV